MSKKFDLESYQKDYRANKLIRVSIGYAKTTKIGNALLCKKENGESLNDYVKLAIANQLRADGLIDNVTGDTNG